MKGFTKSDQGKPDLALWPPRAFVAIGRVLTFGAKEYSPSNWRKVDETRRYWSALFRHLFARLSGEMNDSKSGESHLAHAGCCLAFLLELEEEGRNTVDWEDKDDDVSDSDSGAAPEQPSTQPEPKSLAFCRNCDSHHDYADGC